MLDAELPIVQWAAVRTQRGEIRVPPQNGDVPVMVVRPTWKGRE